MTLNAAILACCIVMSAAGACQCAEPTTAAATTQPAVEDERDPLKFSDEADALAKARRATIGAEIDRLGDHAWAGSYYQGDGLGANLSLVLAPEAGFDYAWHGCLGLYDRNYGAVAQEKPETITLKCARPNEPGTFASIDEQFVVVPWGDRRYLVASDELIDFCNAVNDRDEPRDRVHGSYFLRRGDEKKPVDGKPVLAAPYKSYLLAAPINAVVRKTGVTADDPKLPSPYRATPVTLDVGKRHGVFVGMVLHSSEGDHHTTAEVTEVGEDTSAAIMRFGRDTIFQPEPGWRLSSVPRWRQ